MKYVYLQLQNFDNFCLIRQACDHKCKWKCAVYLQQCNTSRSVVRSKHAEIYPKLQHIETVQDNGSPKEQALSMDNHVSALPVSVTDAFRFPTYMMLDKLFYLIPN